MGSSPSISEPFIYAIPIQDQEKPHNSTPVYRSPEAIDGLVVNFDPPYSTLYQVFKTTCIRYPMNPCLGEQRHHLEGNRYEWLSYSQVDRLVNRASRLIQRHGLANENGLVSLVGPNCNAWIIVDLALNMLGLASVPFFQALTAEARAYILEETEVTSLFGTNQDIFNLLQGGSLAEIKNLICFNPITEELAALAMSVDGQLKLFDFWEEMHKHEKVGQVVPPLIPPGFDTLFTISYTSGTTGRPKGACITNGNMISAMKSHKQVNHGGQEDCLISYLPLAHIMGHIGIFEAFHAGMRIGHWRGNPKTLLEDMQILKPTVIPVVPRILNKIYDKVMNGVAEASPAKRALFRKALNAKVENLRATGQFTHAIYDKIVFKKLQAVLGGRAKLMVTGSAPIAKEVLEFARVAFACHLHQGYAQTESSANAFFTKKFQNRAGHVGGPSVGTEFKLQDIPELNYLSTDSPYPRGQVLIRGPSIFKEYFRQPDKTAEALDADGWLHTGDVGMLIEGNALRIIDRKKHIFKLSQGEYIAPERLERLLQTCSLIAQIFIHGESLQDHIVAVVVPDQQVVREWAKQKGVEGDFAAICASSELHQAIEAQTEQLAKDQGFNSLEKIRGNFIIESEPWTDKDLLTSLQKLQRHKAKEKYAKAFEKLYSK